VDGDGDLDVLAVASTTHTPDIEWFENPGTSGDGGWTKCVISDQLVCPEFVSSADIDGDGDVDVLTASGRDDMIAWHENDGTPRDGGWTSRPISTTTVQANLVYAADIDGDGDVDVLAGSYTEDRIAWHQNDGTPSDGGWTEHVISFNVPSVSSICTDDIDGDGDLDVISAARQQNRICWHENRGVGRYGQWVQHTVSTRALAPRTVVCADVDGDGDPDILSASYNDDKIAWYENLNSSSDDVSNAARATQAER
jgi:hypothetical protein